MTDDVAKAALDLIEKFNELDAFPSSTDILKLQEEGREVIRQSQLPKNIRQASPRESEFVDLPHLTEKQILAWSRKRDSNK